MSRYLGVDVDLTVCPSDRGWGDYLYERGSNQEGINYYSVIQNKAILPYNLGELFPSVENAAEYWRNLDYSLFNPLEGSIEKLAELNEYFDIVFISAIKGNHNKSKYYWLKEHFPFMKGYIATKEKFILNDSVLAMIDDRDSQLMGFDYHKRIRFQTAYHQELSCEVDQSFSDWEKLNTKVFIDKYL